MSQDEISKRAAEFSEQEAAYRAKMIAMFPYELVKTTGAAALSTWSELKARGNGYPVVIGNAEELAGLVDTLFINEQDGRAAAAEISKAQSYRFPEDYTARLARDAEAFRELFANDPRFATSPDEVEEETSWETFVTGKWPDAAAESSGLSVVDEIVAENGTHVSRPALEVYIAILPTRDWTEAFAYLGFGGWNANPFPHEHVAAFRRWRAKYDLELVGVSRDQVNLRCRRPPGSRGEAMDLAREQYEFCPDLLQQGAPSMEALAAQLMGNEWWYFWWD